MKCEKCNDLGYIRVGARFVKCDKHKPKKSIIVRYANNEERPEIENPVTISQAELDYLRKAVKYAMRHGFKATIFSKSGKVIALQG